MRVRIESRSGRFAQLPSCPFGTSVTTLRAAVVNATNGKEALELLNSREDIDMVLTDVLMPEVTKGASAAHSCPALLCSHTKAKFSHLWLQLSGLQLMDELRNARWRDIPVVGEHFPLSTFEGH